MQQKMAAGESPAAEMIKSVSLIIAGLLLLLPGFFTDFLGLLLLLPPVQKHLTMKLMPHLRFSRMPGGGFSAGTGGGETFEGNSSAKMSSATVWTIRTIAAINIPRPGQQMRPGRFLAGLHASRRQLALGKNSHSPASITSAYRLFQPTIASSSRQRMLPTTANSR